MIRFKDINIPKPCSVAYDSLPGDETKRFCDSCEKHVYDFRGKDENYLNEIFRSTGKVCGIYYQDQITSHRYEPFWFQSILKKLIALTLFFKTFTLSAANDAKEIHHTAQPVSQLDTIPAIKASIKGKHPEKLDYRMSIYIDDKLYSSNARIYNNRIYLPDTITDGQSIKIIVHERRSRRHRLKIKPKEYMFKYNESDKVNVKILYKWRLIIIQKKRQTVMGLIRK
jgi:hypothetical protein